MLGLTSISFRGKTCTEVIGLAKKAGLDGIEWGGDVHVPPENEEGAAQVGQMTREAGLEVLSYGSYYRLCQGTDFHPVLRAAKALGAPMIRIWAGSVERETIDPAYMDQAAGELRRVCALAQGEGLRVSLEYHRWTLTWHSDSACMLLKKAGAGNLHTYWQPNPDISHAENCCELAEILPWLSSCHVFQGNRGDERRPLCEGEDVWRDYYRIAGDRRRNSLLEFIRGDSAAQLQADAQVLKQWESAVQGTGAPK